MAAALAWSASGAPAAAAVAPLLLLLPLLLVGLQHRGLLQHRGWLLLLPVAGPPVLAPRLPLAVPLEVPLRDHTCKLALGGEVP